MINVTYLQSSSKVLRRLLRFTSFSFSSPAPPPHFLSQPNVEQLPPTPALSFLAEVQHGPKGFSLKNGWPKLNKT